jgi:hypothetical protein
MGAYIFWCVLPVFAALVIHSYFTKGPRLTFNFYFFSILYVARWVLRKRTFPTIHVPSGTGVIEATRNPLLSFSQPDPPAVFFSLSIIMLCVSLLYLCWAIAERISRRLDSDRIFWTTVFCGLAAASFSYIVEVIGVGFGWWGLRLVYDNFLGRFFSGCPHPVLISWFYFTIYFFLAFFLIELSRLRDKPWKCIFILFAFIHSSVIELFGPGMPAAIEHLIVLAALILFIIYSRLPFDYSYRETKQCHSIIKNIPEILICALMISAYLLFIFVLKKPFMLFSLLPLLMFFSFSLGKKLLLLVMPVLVIAALIDIGPSLPAILGAVILSIFMALQRISGSRAMEDVTRRCPQ